MVAIVFDTETTGKVDPEVIQAWGMIVEILCHDECFFSLHPKLNSLDCLYRPSKPIEIGAMAVHHITNLAVQDDSLPPSSSFRLPDDVDCIIGHNIDYDWGVIGKPDVKRICTLALSRMVWPDLDSHTQNALLYHLMPEDRARKLAMDAHSAVHDVKNLRVIIVNLVEALGVTSIEELWEASEKARIPTVMTFGKHKGTPIAGVPSDYARWLSGQADIDPYLIMAFKNAGVL